MKKTILSISLVLAVFAFMLQMPTINLAGSVADYIAAVGSMSSYGTRLGQTVHDVVLNIRAMDKARGQKSYITHAHVIAIMCQENPKLSINITNGEGRKEGLTQVTTPTWNTMMRGGYGNSCSYIKKLENGACGDLRARTANPRCSIELGACLYNYHLKKNNGNPRRAYNAYNTGRPYKRANGLGSFLRAHSAASRGYLCAKSKSNWPVWKAMHQKISQLTGGRFKTDGAQHVQASAAGWPDDPSKYPSVSNLGNNFWQSSAGKSLSKAMGQGVTSYSKAQQNNNKRKSVGPSSQSRQKSWLDRLFGNRQGHSVVPKPKANLTCTTTSGGVRLQWSCPTGTTISRGLGTNGARFDTHGAGAGAITVATTNGAEYILQCINGHKLHAEAKCIVPLVQSDNGVESVVSTIEPSVDVIPSGVVMRIAYDKANGGSIVWATLGAKECLLTAGSQKKSGKSGRLHIGAQNQNTIVKLECDTIHGKAVKYKRVVVK